MNIDDFWRLIEHIDQSSLAVGDEEKAVAPLVHALAMLPPKEIRSCAEHLSRVLYRIDGEEFADHAGVAGESGDGFLYCRCYVIARGKAFYQGVLANPSIIPNNIEEWCESLLYVPAQAWAVRTGKNADDWDFEATVSYETGSNESQWPSSAPKEEKDPFFDPVFSRAVARAGHHFRSKQYAYVVKLLAQHEALLSHKQLKMLNEARASQYSAPKG